MGESNDYIATTGERWAPLEYGALCVFGPGGRSVKSSEIIAELRVQQARADLYLREMCKACQAQTRREALGE